MPYNPNLHNFYTGNVVSYIEGTGVTHGVSDLDFFDVFRPEDFIGVDDPDNISLINATGVVWNLRNNLWDNTIALTGITPKLSWSAYRCIWYNYDQWVASTKTTIAASSLYGTEEIKLTYQDVGPLDVVHKPYKTSLGYPFKYPLGYFSDGLPTAQTPIPTYIATNPNQAPFVFPLKFDDDTADNLLGGSTIPGSSTPGAPRMPLSNIGTWYSGIAVIYESLFNNPKTPAIHPSFPKDFYTPTNPYPSLLAGFYPTHTHYLEIPSGDSAIYRRNFDNAAGAKIPNFDRGTILSLLDLNLKPNGWYCHNRNSLIYSADFEPMVSGAIPVIDMVLQNNCNREIARSMFVKGSTQTGSGNVSYLACDFNGASVPDPPLGDISLLPISGNMQGNYIHVTPPEAQFIHGEIYFGTTKPKSFNVDISISGNPVYVDAINRDWNNKERVIQYVWTPVAYMKFTPLDSGFPDVDFSDLYFNVPFSSSVYFSEPDVYAYIITDNENPHKNTLKNYQFDIATGWKLSTYEDKAMWNITADGPIHTFPEDYTYSPHRQKIIIPTTTLPITASISVDGIPIPLQDISSNKYNGTLLHDTNIKKLNTAVGETIIDPITYINPSGERWFVTTSPYLGGAPGAIINFTSQVFYSGGFDGIHYQANDVQLRIENGLHEEWINFQTEIFDGSAPNFEGSGTHNTSDLGRRGTEYIPTTLNGEIFSDYNNYQVMRGTLTKVPISQLELLNPDLELTINSCVMRFGLIKYRQETPNNPFPPYTTVEVSGIISNSILTGSGSTTVTFTMPTVENSWWTPA